MSQINPARLSKPLRTYGLLVGLAGTLSLAACGVEPAPGTDEATTSEIADKSTVAASTLGQEMAYINWLYCGSVSYYTTIQYWRNTTGGITLGYINVDQYHSGAGIDYTVQLKTVHDDYHVWWSRGPGTTSGPHLYFPASSTPGTVFPSSWEPYLRLYLGADGDGLANCNFDADLD